MKKIELDSFVEDKTLGYYYVYAPDHELANASGKVYMHRYVASMAAGRALESGEHVHHIDGDRSNNEESNLEIVCASEHAKRHMEERYAPVDIKCPTCGNSFKCPRSRYNKSKSGRIFCSKECRVTGRKKFEIDRDTLLDLVWTYPSTKVAGMFNVSDTTIKKRCAQLGIPKPPRGYWRKVETGHT